MYSYFNKFGYPYPPRLKYDTDKTVSHIWIISKYMGVCMTKTRIK